MINTKSLSTVAFYLDMKDRFGIRIPGDNSFDAYDNVLRTGRFGGRTGYFARIFLDKIEKYPIQFLKN